MTTNGTNGHASTGHQRGLPAQRSVSIEPVVTSKFGKHSYEDIVNHCRKTGILYEDPEFPATSASISSRPQRNYEWKRPGELNENPQFMVGGASRFDVQQGELGNCWLVAAISSLSQFQNLFDNVVATGDCLSFKKSDGYCGAFRFRFWSFGEWTEVVVDDRLPTYKNRLTFVHSAEKNEFWSSLLEKAYAKLYVCYENLRGGSASDAMEDFTGGVIEMFDLRKDPPNNLFALMNKAFSRQSLMGCSVNLASVSTIEEKLPNGLICGHAYSITGVTKVPVNGKNVKMIRSRNPWGNDAEWNGAWSDKSPEWAKVAPEDRAKLQQNAFDDGEFWMSYDDFITSFTKLEICHLGPDYGSSEPSTRTRWEVTAQRGAWKKHVNAGGCSNYRDSFWTNPQYRMTIVDPDDDDDDNAGTLIVAVLQRRKAKSTDMLKLGYSIYKLKDPNQGLLDATFFKLNAPVATFPTFINRREVCHRHKLPPGEYVVIPCTFEPDKEGEFVLRMFTEKPATSAELDEETKPTKPRTPAPAPTAQESEAEKNLRQSFIQIAGADDGELDAYELQGVLNGTFKKEFQFDGFSTDTCRSLVAMMDSDHSGKLGFDEFKVLWNNFRIWKLQFTKHDADKNGTFNSYELRETLRDIGYLVSNSTFNSLIQRYSRKDGKIYFDDYIHCMARLSTMFDIFKGKAKSGQEAKFTMDEFIMTTMYS